jgi:hypothetical protein
MISFMMIYYSKLASITFNSKYPTVSCASITETYQKGALDLQTYAIREHRNYYNTENVSEADKNGLQGPLKCFCD